VFLLLLFGLSLLAAWMYWQSPSLQTLKPAIAHYIQQQLQLKELRMGQLSWHWAGFLWLRVDGLDFTSADESLAFHGGTAAVRIPLRALISGDIQPDRIRLSGGALDLHIGGDTPLVANQLMLEHVNLNWRYGDWHGRIAALSLTLDHAAHRLNATSPSLRISAQMDADGLPHRLTLHGQHTDWLPDQLAQRMRGEPEFNITVKRLDPLHWQLTTSITSEHTLSIMPETMYALQLNQLDADMKLAIQPGDALQLDSVAIGKLQWRLADNRITAHGRWQDGVLKLNAASDRLAMPIIWAWLRPLGDAGWRHWLSLMHAGSASQTSAALKLAWPDPLRDWPDPDAWNKMQYHLHAQVEDADFALGMSDDTLRHTHVQVDLNQDGMHATFLDTQLPRDLGHSSGTLFIPWNTLELHVAGSSTADVAKLLQWFGPGDIAGWQWHRAKAHSTYKLLWNLNEATPKQASVILHPDGSWHVSLHGLDLNLSGGAVHWDQNSGLKMTDMHIYNTYLHTSLSLQAAATDNKWAITGLSAVGTGQLAPLAAHFQLPLSHAGGTFTTNLNYDGHWFGQLDLQQASWERLLGSSKQAGDPLSIRYQGKLDLSGDAPTIHLNNMSSQGNKIKLYEGAASINRDGLKAQLKGLHTPSFSGSLDIDIPFDNKSAWKIYANARYLNRNALPESLDHPEQVLDKDWLLRADIDQFDWDDARMSGVHINLSSGKDSIGILEAAQIHTTQLDIMDVDARFTLPGQGRVELRTFSASLEKQHLAMSATLTPQTGGGMRWQGFAELSGDFGHLMRLSGLSEGFIGGTSHILFSGQGIMLREQPWWQGLDGRLRLRVDQGRILEGGTLTTLLAAMNLSQLPALLLGQRQDLTGPGIMFKRLQMEAIMQNQDIRIRNVAMRSAAFDLVGHGSMDIARAVIDLYLVVKPLQNLDALLSKIPLLRDILGGASHSLLRKIYHMHGPFNDAKVDEVSPEDAGLASKGFIEHLLSLPGEWFGSDKTPTPQPGR